MAFPAIGRPVDDPRAFLHDFPLLQFVPVEARKLVVDSFVPVSFAFGDPIVTRATLPTPSTSSCRARRGYSRPAPAARRSR